MKSFRPLTLAALAAGCLTFAAHAGAWVTGSGKIASETRALSGLHGVEMEVSGTLDIVPGDKEEIVVETDDNLLPLLETTVRPDGILVITFKRGESIRNSSEMHFKLTAKNTDAIVLKGSGKIHFAGKLANNSTTLMVQGSGDIVVDRLEASSLFVSIPGSGTVKVLAGAVEHTDVKVAGSGDYIAEEFKTDIAKVSVAGSGACKVWAEKTLDVNISGSGEVTYRGGAQVRQRVTGSGTVRALGARAI